MVESQKTERSVTELYLEVLARADGQDSLYHMTGNAYAFIPGTRPQKLFSINGFNIRRRVETAEKDGFFVATRELVFYTDATTGEVLDNWDNPITGQTNEVFHIDNDPVNFRMRSKGEGQWVAVMNDGSRELGPPSAPKEMGDYYVWASDVFPFYPLPGWEKNYTSCEIFDFYVPKSARFSAESPPIMNTWVRVGPWLPWMGMDGHEGNIIYHAHSFRHDSFEALPDNIKTLVRQKYPKYQTAPDTVDPTRPNATSWTVYRAEMEKRGTGER